MASNQWKTAAAITGVVAATILVFWPITRGQFLNFDDNLYLTGQPHARTGLSLANFAWAWTTFDTGNYHPLTWLSLQLDAQLFGLNPAGFHWVNLLLHAANALLLFTLLLRMTGSAGRSLAVAMIWAVHPLRLESVAWIAERKDVLSSFMGLLALHAYVGGSMWSTTLCMALSLLAKPTLVTLPGLIVLLEYWPLGRWQSVIQNPTSAFLRFALLLGLALAQSIVTMIAQDRSGSLIPMALDLRLTHAIVSLVRYPLMMLWPMNLATPYSPPVWMPWWIIGGAGLILAGITRIVWRWRGMFPATWVGWGWYLIAMVPMIGVIKAGSQAMADRYTYWPMMGLLIAAAFSIRLPARIGVTITATAVLSGAALTWQGAAHWRDSRSLLGRAARLTHDNAMAHWKYGDALGEAAEHRAAMDQYRLALRINPSLHSARRNLAAALTNEGRLDEAIGQMEFVVQQEPANAEYHLLLGRLLINARRPIQAASELSQVLKFDPANAQAAEWLRMLPTLVTPITPASKP